MAIFCYSAWDYTVREIREHHPKAAVMRHMPAGHAPADGPRWYVFDTVEEAWEHPTSKVMARTERPYETTPRMQERRAQEVRNVALR